MGKGGPEILQEATKEIVESVIPMLSGSRRK